MRLILEIYFGINLFLAGIQFGDIDLENTVGRRILIIAIVLLFGTLFFAIDVILTPIRRIGTFFQISFFWQYLIRGNFKDLTTEQLERVNEISDMKENNIEGRIYKYCTELVNKRNNYKHG